jgi:HEAT repeat protein
MSIDRPTAKVETAESPPAPPPSPRARVSADAVRRALGLERQVFQATGRWLRIGDILLLRGDIPEAHVASFAGSALFPGNGQGRGMAELVGEIALRKNLITPEQFAECLEVQVQERLRGTPRAFGSILVGKSYLRPKDLRVCEAELRRDARLREAESKRVPRMVGDRPVLTPLDARYVNAARRGELPAREVVSALERLERLRKVLGRRFALWEDLLVREVVEPEDHKRVLDESFNVRENGGSWLLGGILVELGYASAGDIETALGIRTAEEQRNGGKPRPLGEILVERRVCSLTELEEALRIQAVRRRGGPRRLAPRPPSRRTAAAIVAAAGLAALAVFVGWPELRFQRALAAATDPRAPPAARIQAVTFLAHDPSPASIAAIAHAADVGAPPDLRAAAIAALAPTKADPVVAGVLKQALDDDAARLRAIAAWAFGERREEAARASLRARLEDEAPGVRLAAARSLALLGDPDGRELLVAALKPDRPERRRLAASLDRPEAEVRLGVEQALEALSGFALGDAYERWDLWLSLQPVADAVCGRRRGPQAAARFTRLLESETLSVRFCAARALAHLGDRRAIPALVRALDRRDLEFRAALRTERGIELDELGPEIAALLSLLTGRNFGTDFAAWDAWLDERRAPGTGS